MINKRIAAQPNSMRSLYDHNSMNQYNRSTNSIRVPITMISQSISSSHSAGYHRAYRTSCTSKKFVVLSMSSQAGKLLLDGKSKFQAGDRMGALKLWEQAIELDPNPQQRQIALFNATCVHASFGDIELAQITLREAVQCGLDFLKAYESPQEVDPALVNLVSSQQVLIRLKKFNEATLKAMKSASNTPTEGTRPISGGSGRARSTKSMSTIKSAVFNNEDVADLLETDVQGIDSSVIGIVKRVALVLVALSGIGVGLFYVGIRYLFPEGS